MMLMRKFLPLVMLLACLSTGLRAQTVTINMEKAGTLDSIVTAQGNRYTITSLKLNGPLNGADFKTLRDMGGVKNYTTQTAGKLRELDLSGATIVASNDVYFSYQGVDFTSKNNDFGDYFLYNCQKIDTLLLPTNITRLGTMALASLTSLKHIDIPESVTSIGLGCFIMCNSLKEVTIPNSVTWIGMSAFQRMDGLEAITFGDGVTELPNSVFVNDVALKTINLGKGMKTVKPIDVNGLTGLEAINVADGNPYLSSSDGILFNSDKTTLKIYPVNHAGESYSIPAGVKTVGVSAFQGAANLTSVTFPASVETVDSMAFFDCAALSQVQLNEGLKSIHQAAFGITPENEGSLTALEIPASVNDIQGGAFYCNAALTNLTVAEGNGSYTMNGSCLYSKDLSTLAYVPVTLQADSFVVNPAVKTILPFAFSSCTGIRVINLGDNVEEIGMAAFFYDAALEKLIIGKGIKRLGTQIPAYCAALNSVYFNASSIDDSGIDEYAFFDESGSVMSQATLYVPKGRTDYYQTKRGFYIELGEGEETEAYFFFANIAESDEQTTAISKPKADTSSVPAAAYNIAGQRVSTSQKGLVIVRNSNGITEKLLRK